MITNIITTMITNITITIMMKNAAVDADMITTMIMNIIIITIMMKNAAVDVDMTMITTTIIIPEASIRIRGALSLERR